MSVKTDLSCSKFQANIFNKSRCQNCFKSRELHLLTSEEFDQAKPIYASWLCLAPEGTDFDNPLQRSRKWQRRFFILYEHGSLQFALDESPSTIPQGTVDLNLCTEVFDAEARTGQKNALCISTPEQEIFIRGDSREIINGWSEQLTVFLQTNKQNQRKKSKVPSVQSQDHASENAVRSIGAPETEAVVEGNDSCSPEQDEGQCTKTWANKRGQDVKSALATDDLGSGKIEPYDAFHEMCSVDTVEGSRLPPRLRLSCPSPEPWAECDPFPLDCSPPNSNSTLTSSTSSVNWELDEDTDSNASSHDESLSLTQIIERDQTDQRHEECDSEDSCFTSSSRVQDDYSTDERKGEMCHRCRRRGRSRSQTHIIQKEESAGLLEVPQSSLRPQRRARSLDGRASDVTTTPDLLNIKKGWLLSLNDHEQWRKYWFVLSAHSLHYYLDPGAEETSELVGEIDLTTCHQVTENQVQRNYGFQLHTHKQVYTLAAMTAGIRQNWIQALLKNIQNRNAPDVASLADNHRLQVEALCRPDVTQDSRSTQRCPEQWSSHNKRHKHDAKTFDWDEVGHISHVVDQESSREQKRTDLQTENEREEQESRSRRRGREERRQRYAMVMGSLASPQEESSNLGSLEHQQQRMREIEERWLQVERTAVREGKKVPLYPECENKSAAELENLLEQYRRRVEQLTSRLTDSASENQSLEQEHNTDWSCHEPTHDLRVQHKSQKMGSNKQSPVLTLSDKYQETKQLLQLENLRRQQIKNQLGLCPSAQFLNESDIKNRRNMPCETTFNKSGLASYACCEASRDWEDEHSMGEGDGFSERGAQAVKENIGTDPTVVMRFSQEAEFLARQNEALKQHNQELLNQLAEANREIDRLKAELLHRPNGCQSEQESVVERLEMELALNHGKLQEAWIKLAEMEENLKDTQRALQLREATLRGLGFLTKDHEKMSADVIEISSQEETDRLCQCELELSELQSQLDLSEETCRDLQTQNVLLKETELLNGHRIIEAEETIKTLRRELERVASSRGEGLMHLQKQEVQDGRKSREGMQHVLEGRIRLTSSVLSILLEVIKRIAGNENQGSASKPESPTVVMRLQLEQNIWESLVNALKDNPSQGMEILLWGAEMKLEEIKMYLSALSVSTDGSKPLSVSKDSDQRNSTDMSLSNLDIIQTQDGTMKDEKEKPTLFNEQLDQIWRSLKQCVKNRLTLLKHIASELESSLDERQCDICMQTDELYLDPVVSAVLDLFTACLIGNRGDQKERTLPIFEIFCSSTVSVEVQTESNERTLEHNNSCEKTEENEETEAIGSLRSRIEELEQLLAEGAKRLASLQQQHEEDKDRLKMDIVAAYERGFTVLKESHQRLTEDLLIKHQQEQELLQEEKERLLAEEAAATLIVIEAMKRAHCSELEQVLQKANESKTRGDTATDDILKNDSEELASVQRELDVLSELYSQKCLEGVHLAQALEEERKTLQHCQHENLALSSRYRELNNHLVEEFIRLSTLAKDGTGQLVDNREQFELEIMLQIKESEVICLQQDIGMLKNELERAQTDQKLAIERFQELQTDHCMVKKKAEQQVEQLKEHLRLAYEALAESMEKKTSATALNGAHHTLLKSRH